jgi:uncharacterized repeat protein (TIGR03806 family)
MGEARKVVPRAAFAAAAAAAAGILGFGCGGGGAGGPVAPFGLDQRVPVASLAFPLAVPEEGSARFVDAFPALPAFEAPVLATHAPSGEDRIFVVERRGRVRVVRNDRAATEAPVFLDITSRVTDAGHEEGLLGLAFHPDHGTNGLFYVLYAEAGPTPCKTVIARYAATSDPDVADPASEVRLLTLSPPFRDHNGGTLAFGPDGFLYVSVGDGGSGGDPYDLAQDVGSPFGKVLRIDVDRTEGALPYAIPPDNPFATGTGGARREIYAWGLRNPWRMSFDRLTGTLWCGDVGQAEREEVSVLRKGGNYGWNAKEGTRTYDPGAAVGGPFEPPVHEYVSDSNAVIGGHVYRGAAVPALAGAYVYGDHAAGTVWALTSDGTTATSNVVLDRVEGLSSFGEDRAGEILACGVFDGRVRRMEANEGGGEPPAFPALLSETGLFADVATLRPAPGLVPYDVNAPLWSDGALKDRMLALPGLERIGWSRDGPWTFPTGTVLAKTFRLPLVEGDPASAVRVETRVLLRGAGGWEGFVYRWREDETDADLIAEAEERVLSVATPGGTAARTWRFPSRAECFQCHTEAAGRVLGLTTRQLRRTFDYGPYGGVPDDQLRTWEHLGLFDRALPATASLPAHPDPSDESLPVAPRARAYLETNCSVCHRAGGTSPAMDLRSTVATSAMGVVGVAPQAGDLGVAGALLVTPGDRARSVLWLRLREPGAHRMPPLATSVVDEAGSDLVGRWIDEGP